jgi:diguanylate cyclase (GGDEF)-like protein/PAS domain S-box-containing protein
MAKTGHKNDDAERVAERARESAPEPADRTPADATLREHDDMFKKLSFHIPGMIYQFMKRPDGTYCVPFTTDAIKHIFGCTPQDVREDFSPIARAIWPEDLAGVIESIESSAERMAPWQYEYRVQIPGGPVRWVLGQSTPERMADGAIIWHGFNTDITDIKRAEDALQDSEEWFRGLFENPVLGIFRTTPDGRIRMANPALLRMLGYDSLEDLQKRDLAMEGFESESPREEFQKRIEREGVVGGQESAWKRKDGSTIHVRENTRLVRDKFGRALYYDGTVEDITADKRGEALRSAVYKIAESATTAKSLEEIFRTIHSIVGGLMPASNFYIALHDPGMRMLSFPYFVDEFDESPLPTPLGRGLTEYVLHHGEPLLANPQKFQELVDAGDVESIGAPSIDWLGVPLKVNDKTIGVMVVQTYTEGVRFNDGDKDILMFISFQAAQAIERKRMEEALRELSMVDELTGLNNRRSFSILATQQIKIAERSRQKAVLIFVDVDGLKKINDTFGHPAGDRALRDAAEVLKISFRASDVVARLGGDEFAGLALEAVAMAGETILARLKENIDAFNLREDRPYRLSMSFGLDRYDPEAPRTLDDLLKCADASMYEHKQRETR